MLRFLRRSLLLAILSVAVCALAPTLASAQRQGRNAAPATRFLQKKHDAVLRMLRQPDNADRAARISREITALLDYDELARRSLQGTWDGLTEQQRTDFVSLLRQLIERNYRGNLERTLQYEIRYGTETTANGETHVPTTVRHRTNRRAPQIEIEYLLRADGSNYKVIDVVTDGVSMVRNYRTQFTRIVQRESFDALLGRMRARLESGSGF